MGKPENRPLSRKFYQCENCLKKTNLPPDYDERHFCSEECRLKYRELKMKTPYIGEHVVSPRKGYIHHGLGDNKGGIIHYSGFSEHAASGPVIHSTIEEFSQGQRLYVMSHHGRKYDFFRSVNRAERRMGEKNYMLPSNNCEHFVNWCIDGTFKSRQVQRIAFYITLTAIALTFILVLHIAASVGYGAVKNSKLFPWLAEIDYRSGALIILNGLGLICGLALITAMKIILMPNHQWLSQEERYSRQTAVGLAYITVFTSVILCHVYSWIISVQIHEKTLSRHLSANALARLINISLLICIALPSTLGVIVGFTVYRIISRRNS